MMSKPASDVDNHASQPGDTDQVFSFLFRDIGAPLTVIKGHAQLIRRRSTRGTREDAILMERSVAAIELAVHNIIVSLGQSATKIVVREI